MADIDFPCWVILQTLDNALVLAEAIGFPEFGRLDRAPERARDGLRRNLKKRIEEAALSSLHRRQINGQPAPATVILPLGPSGPAAWWRQPLPLRFPALFWNHGEHAALALVPALGLVVAADDIETLSARIGDEVRAALARGPQLSLERLVALQRTTRLRVEKVAVRVALRSAKARAQAALREHEKTPSVLRQVASDLTRTPPEPAWGLEPLVGQIAELLTARQARSVLLVGPSGVGKTAAVRELAHSRARYHLGASPFWATSGARLVAGMTGYGMWQQRCGQVVREASRKKAILDLGNLVELMQVGKTEHHTLGIAAFLRPYLARGELLAVAECTPEQVPLIERDDPHLLGAFHQLAVAEPNVEQGRAILRHAAEAAQPELRKPLAEDALDTLDRLHRRYTTYSAYPGRPLRFLRNLLGDCAAEPEIRASNVLAAFTRETGLPRVLLDPAMPLDLEKLRGWLGERVVGQAEAVGLVADLIATTKAGLTRPRRPIASLLFIGPTGVGKTETAKALAEFLFGSRDRMTRFDMSEFGDPLSVQRLVGLGGGSEGLLTARVREQPFGVLLFDEFEKAHPQFLDLLLQVLGEGRLTDGAGRLADFTNAVIILTSNLGAESYQAGAFGFGRASAADADGQRRAAREHFQGEVQRFLRPEMYNRLDRVVPFAPLDAGTIKAIAERHLHRLELRDGIRQRGVALRLGEGVAEHLARAGFDARYGARPLLRAIEREMLAPLAEQVNRYSGEVALSASVNLEGGALRISVKPRTDAGGRVVSAGTGAAATADAARTCVELRRSVQTLENCRAVREFRNELFRLEREQQRLEAAQQRHAARMARLAETGASEEVRQRGEARAPRIGPADRERMATLARLRGIADRLRDLVSGSAALEDEALLALYASAGAEAFAPADLEAAARPLRQLWDELVLTLYCRQFPASNRVTLALFSEDRAWLAELAAAYVGAARQLGLVFNVLAYFLPAAGRLPADAGGKAPERGTTDALPPRQYWRNETLIAAPSGRESEREVLTRDLVKDVDAFLADLPQRLPGLALELHGTAAAPRFVPEQGLHILRGPKQPQPGVCLLEAGDTALAAYVPPPGITRKGAIGTQDRRRTYDRGLALLDDARLLVRVSWQNRPLAAALAEAIEANLRRCLHSLLQE
jgi:ATP-dependent Clp protease ATP-binding subunit ClpA